MHALFIDSAHKDTCPGLSSLMHAMHCVLGSCSSIMYLEILISALHATNPQVMKEDDNNWPAPDRVGRQELEVIVGNDHVSYTCTKLGSVLQVQQSKDPEGLRIFYYLVQVRTRM